MAFNLSWLRVLDPCYRWTHAEGDCPCTCATVSPFTVYRPTLSERIRHCSRAVHCYAANTKTALQLYVREHYVFWLVIIPCMTALFGIALVTAGAFRSISIVWRSDWHELVALWGTILKVLVFVALIMTVASPLGDLLLLLIRPPRVKAIVLAPYNWWWRHWGFRWYYWWHNFRLPCTPVD